MNVLDLIITIYGKLRNYPNVPFWVLTPARKFVRSLANYLLPRYLSKIDGKRQEGNSDIIVSLTSFPLRIENVWQVVACMLNQTMQPKFIFLWLSKKQFPNRDLIPESLKRLEGDIFKIMLVDDDIRSHKKYLYVSISHPEDYVFLVDDDIYYSSKILEKSWHAHLEYPDSIICNYGYHYGVSDNNELASYNSWKLCYEGGCNDIFFGSGGGTLYKPSMMYKELTNIEKALALAPTADDIWLNAMAKKNNTNVVLLPNGQFLPIKSNSNQTLTAINVSESQNDTQLKAVWEYLKL